MSEFLSVDPVLARYLIEVAANNNYKEYLQEEGVDADYIEKVTQPPEMTPEINAMLLNTGYTEEQLISVLEFEPDIDGMGEVRDGGYSFAIDRL